MEEKLNFSEISAFRFGYSPVGKPKFFTYIYYVDGLLIDTGPSRMRKQVLSETQDLPIDQIFITHFHEDHTGNIRQLIHRHGCPVYAPKITSEIMKAPPQISFIQHVMYGSRGGFDKLIPTEKYIETRKYRFQIIPIPGHAIDKVCLYEPQKKWLFSADLYINSYIGYFLADESISLQIDSIKRILAFEFESMYCAHNPQLKNGKKQLAKKLDFLESFSQHVQSLYLSGYSEKEIFNRMKLKESKMVKFLSGGYISKLNMVRSVINDLDERPISTI